MSISCCQALGKSIYSLFVSAGRKLVVLIPAAFLLSLLGNVDLLGETRGDFGRIVGDSTGTVSVERSYWSNKATSLMSDRPTQAGVEPRLWGKVVFE